MITFGTRRGLALVLLSFHHNLHGSVKNCSRGLSKQQRGPRCCISEIDEANDRAVVCSAPAPEEVVWSSWRRLARASSFMRMING